VGEVPRPTHYLYRDYVIRSFRDDKPYDQFLLEQIAGDELVDFHNVVRTVIELPSAVTDAVIATGFLRNSADASRPDFVSIKHAPMYYFDTLNDSIAIVGSAMLGITVQCAKCHDHKYDPISQREYYEMQSVFMGGYRPDQWIPEEHRYIEWASDVEKARAAAHNRLVQTDIDKLRAESKSLDEQAAEKLFNQRISQLPEAIREDVRQAFLAEEKVRNEVQKYLVSKFQKELRPPREELLKLDAEFQAQSAKLDSSIRNEEAKKRVFTKIRALYDMPGEPTTRVLKRGDWRTLGEDVRPGVPSAISTPLPFAWEPSVAAPSSSSGEPTGESDSKDINRVAHSSSGRRLAFARWLTQPTHPLTARVMVNRIWLHHFGEGLVQTPDDFGSRGSAPSHPELLDWLAAEFVSRQWSIKAMHRLIMTSTVYRQSSHKDSFVADAAVSTGVLQRHATEIDPTNRLLWHFPLQRLDAEAIRDSILAVAGSINRTQFGPPIPLVTRPDGEVVAPDGAAGLRRSVYLFVGRKVPVTMLNLFDQPMISVNCTRRGTSTLASQALDLLNSDFMIRQAESVADRLIREALPAEFGQPNWNPTPAIAFAYSASFCRPATGVELREAELFLRDQAVRYLSAGETDSGDDTDRLRNAQRKALADFAHMLLSSNEFVYVD
jgi:hypothetical protein